MKFKILDIPEPILPEINLTLSGDEARALTAVLGKVSGYCHSDSPRVFLSELYGKLNEGGYTCKPLGNQFIWKGQKFKLGHSMKVDKL